MEAYLSGPTKMQSYSLASKLLTSVTSEVIRGCKPEVAVNMTDEKWALKILARYARFKNMLMLTYAFSFLLYRFSLILFAKSTVEHLKIPPKRRNDAALFYKKTMKKSPRRADEPIRSDLFHISWASNDKRVFIHTHKCAFLKKIKKNWN